MSPRYVTCPACNAQPNHPCNVPTDTGRRDVSWYHYSRLRAAENIDEGEPND